jgi:hypothetical protein
MTKNTIRSAIIIIVLVISLGAFVWYMKDNSSTISGVNQSGKGIQMDSSVPSVTVPSKNTSTLFSTTTASGDVVTIEISPCATEYNNEKLLCFGSGTYKYTESEGVWLYDLVSDDTSDRFGGGLLGDKNLFIISLTSKKHTLTDKEYQLYRKEIIRLLQAKSTKKP